MSDTPNLHDLNCKALPEHKSEDIPLYKLTLWFLGLIAVSSVVGIIFLAAFNKSIPESVIAIGSASVGALAGVLAPGKN